MIKGPTYSLVNALRLVVLFVVAVCFTISCSKPDEPVVIPPLPPVVNPPSTAPSGVIENFSIDDTLIGYNKSTFGRWLVTGTNSLTVLTWGGNSVGVTSTGFSTGVLKHDSLMILALNSGQQRSQMVHVADMITSKLFNEGKSLRKTRSEVFRDTVFVDSAAAITAKDKEERLFFNLNNRVTIINIITPSPPDGGPFTIIDLGSPAMGMIPAVPAVFSWQMITYTIVQLDDRQLTVKYKAPIEPGGAIVDWRDTYTYQ